MPNPTTTLEALRASEALQRALLDALPDLVFRLSREGVYLDYHAGDEADLLVSQDVRGRSLGEFFPPDIEREALEKIEASLADRQLRTFEYELDLPTGHQIFEARLVPSGADEVIAIVRNVTSQRQAESLHRRFVERVLQAQEEERRRVARELHDDTGQYLTSISVGLAALEEAKDLVDVQQQARAIREVASRATGELSRLARGLHPYPIDDLGLCAAVERLIAELGEQHQAGLDLQCVGRGYEELPKLFAAAVYRILQEALTNVCRHAEAQSASIVIQLESEELRMVVEDDGAGFDLETLDASGRIGLGLYGIRERVALLGGEVEIESSPGQGTMVAVRLPIDHAPRR